MKKNRYFHIISVLLGLLLAVQGPAIAQVSVSIQIDIVAKITTHPDYYNTNLPLQMTAPVVADLDCDWILEVISAGYNSETQKSNVYIWNRSGIIQSGWPIEVDGKIAYAPAVGDLDGDGDLEVVVAVSNIPPATGGWIYKWHHDGNLYKDPHKDPPPENPERLRYTPGAPHIGDITEGFEEEVIVLEESVGVALADMDSDGKKELIIAWPSGIGVYGGGDIDSDTWPLGIVLRVGDPVVGDIDGDGRSEVFLAVRIPDVDVNYIYAWDSDGRLLWDTPINIGDVVNAPGNFISLGDINADGTAEILSGSTNGWITVWDSDGEVLFSHRPDAGEESADTNIIFQPIVGDIDNDGDMEILAASKSGNIYCFDNNGNPISGWPLSIDSELSPGAVLVDIEEDSVGDPVNPVGDLELLYSANDGMVHSIDLPGDFHPNEIQWGMYGYNSRNTNNYLRDWNTNGWFVFDNEPEGANMESVYDWNRGGRVIELKGAGLNNCYVFKKSDGRPFNSKDTTLQWSMRYSLPFNIYVSVDTTKGLRFLYYTPVDGNQLIDETGRYIHHGLGQDSRDGRWHTFYRSLVTDLKDAEPDNEIIDINAFYIQGSGRIDDVSLFPGLPAVDIINIAKDADVVVSSGDETAQFINDGDPETKWVSGEADLSSYAILTWDTPQKINKIVIVGVEGATRCRVFYADSEGIKVLMYTNEDGEEEEWFRLPEDGSPLELIFNTTDDISSVMVEFDNNGGSVSVGEIEIYYDPSLEDELPPGDEEEGPPEEEFTSDSYIQIQDGYFWNPALGESGNYWIPHGIAYQTWNRALGQWQSPPELKKDLDMMVEVGANALRADFVWKHIEIEDGVYDWARYDMFLEEAQVRGMKVFPIIGYQWPPDWFPPEWYTMHPQNERHPNGPWLSDILSYEDPEVLGQFRDFLQAVVGRYSVGGVREDLSDTVVGWILGNEYGYLGLWSLEYDGYDPDCQGAFREWLEDRYIDIESLNNKWAQDNVKTPGYLPSYPYESFDEVDMPISFGYEGETKGKYLARDKASWYDLTQWREESIARFVALAAQAVRDVDPYHLMSYAAVGMQWGEEDWRYHTEDARKIANACRDIGAPLSFWSINNYPWGLENSELMTGQWGIARAKHDTGLPVLVTETGFTSTETMYPGIDEERQAKLVRNTIWESLESGAIGVCVFHWNDREQVGLTERERDFGIVDVGDNPKPAYSAVKEAFGLMDNIDIGRYIVGSSGPVPNIAFLWDDAVDTIVNRYQAEMKELYGTLERLGYEPYFINDGELLDGVYLDYDAIVLPRNQKMFDWTFDLLDDIVSAGVKLHADSDLPGIMNEYGEPRDRTDWLRVMRELFGIDATASRIDPDLEDDIYYDGYEVSSFLPINLTYKPKTLIYPLIYPGIDFNKTVKMWKYRDGILPDGGIVMAAFDNEVGNPALVFHFDTAAISLFSLGDNKPIDSIPYSDWTWQDRYNWIRSIYMEDTGFGLTPRLLVSNPYILVDYRICRDNSVLLSFKNYKPDTTETTTVTTDLIIGKTIKDLINGVIIDEISSGTIQRTLESDGHDLLLAYSERNDTDNIPDGGDKDGDGDDDDDDDNDNDDDDDGTGGNPDKNPSGAENPGGTGGDSPISKETNSNYPANPAEVQDNDGIVDPSSMNIWGPASVIVLEDSNKEKRDNGIEVHDEEMSQGIVPSTNTWDYKRSYGGSKDHHSDKPPETIAQEIPPIRQFQEIIEQIKYEEPGQTRVRPKPTSRIKMEEMIRSSYEIRKKEDIGYPKGLMVTVNSWINRFTKVWQDIINSIKSVLRRERVRPVL